MPVGCVCWGMLRPGTAALRWVAILQRGRTGGAIGCLLSLNLTECARPRAQEGGDIDAVFRISAGCVCWAMLRPGTAALHGGKNYFDRCSPWSTLTGCTGDWPGCYMWRNSGCST